MQGFGVWRSLVAHLHGVQGVEGSNPFTPTITTSKGVRFHPPDALFHWENKALVSDDVQRDPLTADARPGNIPGNKPGQPLKPGDLFPGPHCETQRSPVGASPLC